MCRSTREVAYVGYRSDSRSESAGLSCRSHAEVEAPDGAALVWDRITKFEGRGTRGEVRQRPTRPLDTGVRDESIALPRNSYLA